MLRSAVKIISIIKWYGTECKPKFILSIKEEKNMNMDVMTANYQGIRDRAKEELKKIENKGVS